MQKTGVLICNLTGIILTVLLSTGCAQTPTHPKDVVSKVPAPEPDGIVVVGQGTDKDRDVINSSDQQFFNAEHSGIPIPQTPVPAPLPATPPASQTQESTPQ